MFESSNNTGSTAYPGGLPFKAQSTDTLQYLGKQVGKIIEARVVKVVADLTAPTSTRTEQATRSKQAPISTNPPRTTQQSAGEKNSSTYAIELAVGRERLQISAALAPRIGQTLLLEVITAGELRLVPPSETSTGKQTTINPQQDTKSQVNTTLQQNTGIQQKAKPQQTANPAAPKTAQTIATNITATTTTTTTTKSTDQSIASHTNKPSPSALTENIQQSLRSTLPRQLSRTELPLAFNQLFALLSKPTTATEQTTTTKSDVSAQAFSRSTNTPLNNTPTAHHTKTIDTQQQGSTPLNSIEKSTSLLNFQTINKAAQRDPLAISKLLNSVASLQTSIPDYSKLLLPEGVRNALLNSGHFYEQKLGKLITENRLAGLHSNTTSSSTAQPAEESPRTTNNVALTSRVAAALRSDDIQSDLKFNLLTIAKQLKSLLSTSQTTTGAPNTARPLQHEAPLQLLWQLGQSGFLSSTSRPDTANNTQNDYLDTLLQLLRASLGTVARSQSQQLVALGSQIAATADTTVSPNLAMELPLWVDQKLAIIDLHLEQENNPLNKARQASKTWHLRMRFDLEEYGELTVLASLHQRNLSAVLWASEAILHEKIKQELSEVTQNFINAGLEVQHFQCRIGTIEIDKNESIAQLLATSLLDASI